MFPWLFNVYMDTVIKEVKMGIGRMEVRILRESGDHLAFCLKWEEKCRCHHERIRELWKVM